jgi:hypothetical protein
MTAHDRLLMRELDHRCDRGIDVRLLWRPDDGRVAVAVADTRTGEDFTIDVADPSSARDVFRHPYAYASWQGQRSRLVVDLAVAR